MKNLTGVEGRAVRPYREIKERETCADEENEKTSIGDVPSFPHFFASMCVYPTRRSLHKLIAAHVWSICLWQISPKLVILGSN